MVWGSCQATKWYWGGMPDVFWRVCKRFDSWVVVKVSLFGMEHWVLCCTDNTFLLTLRALALVTLGLNEYIYAVAADGQPCVRTATERHLRR